jgi:regulator of RNase E activity RraA
MLNLDSLTQPDLTPDEQTAAYNRADAIIDGAVRDVHRIRAIGFPVFARRTSVYDSKYSQGRTCAPRG